MRRLGRELIIALLLGFPSLSLINGAVLMRNLKNFIRETPRIETDQDLSRFRKIVKQQMYSALLQIFFLGTPVFIFSYGVKIGTLGFSDVLLVVVPNLAVILFGLLMKSLEKKGQSITSSSPELKNEIEHVIYSWKKKAIPDWK